jgi:glyoxylase-like metal-dependent hydrolase (beta-lactamase superfamily II)
MPNLQDVEYHILSDGITWVDGGGAFGLVPRVVWEQLIPPDEKNRIPFSINSLLIRSEGKLILVDTGYGNKLTDRAHRNTGLERPQGDLLAALGRLAVKADDIDIVVNTHLHSDHCGGNTCLQDDSLSPAFPNAQYLIQRLEWSDAILPNERTRATYLPENYQPLEKTGHLKIVNGNARITGQVRTAVTRGHTRAHQVIVIESKGETALFVADLATLHYHFERLAWVTGYDVEPLEAIETKRYWQHWAVEKDALVIFQHDLHLPTGKLRSDGRHFKMEPVLIAD